MVSQTGRTSKPFFSATFFMTRTTRTAKHTVPSTRYSTSLNSYFRPTKNFSTNTTMCNPIFSSSSINPDVTTSKLNEAMDSESKKIAKNNLASLPLPFPWKLYQLLEDSENNGTENIISWLPEGESFAVKKPNEFAKDMMSLYFRLGSYQSFTREVSSP